MTLFVREKSFYRRMLALTVPLALQNLITVGVSMADTMMLGRLSDVHLSAAAQANQVGFIFMLLVFGLGSGSNVLIAQFWGKKDIDSIHKVITVMYRCMLVGCVVFTAIAVGIPRQAMSVLSRDAEVIDAGARFLRIVGLSYFFAGTASCTGVMLRAVGSIRIAVITALASLAANASLNWLLIFDHPRLGLTGLGIEGAAIATCVARTVEVTIAAVYLLRIDKKIQYRLRYLFGRNLGILGNFMQNSLPVVFNELLWGMGMSMLAVIIGRMDTAFVAANSVCSIVSQIVSVIMLGVGNAAGVIIGNTVGEGQYGKAKEYAATFTSISVLLGLWACGMVLLIRDPIISIYNISELAKTYARQIITIHSVVVIFQTFATVALMGTLRGGGDTRFVLLMDIIFVWCLCIPLGFVTGLGLHWPVPAVYAVIKCDDIFKSIMAMLRFRWGGWINDVTKNYDK